MKKLLVSSFIAVLSIAGALASAPQANAASDYDTAYRSITPLLVEGGTCTPYDASTDWSEQIFENTTYGPRLSNALDNGSWSVSVSRYEVGGNDYSTLYIYWMENDPGKVTFSGAPTYPVTNYQATLSGQTMNYAQISLNTSTCEKETPSFGAWTGLNNGDGTMISESTAFGEYGSFNYLVTSPVTYPSGYEGEEVVSSGGGSTESSYVPNIQIQNVLDNKVTFNDKNFFTFDGIMWTCSEDGDSIIEDDSGLAPVMYWQIWRNDVEPNVMIADGYGSATAPIEYKFLGQFDSSREYRIAAWYECGGDVDFTDASNTVFEVDANGMLVKDLFEACIDENFPFIHADGCMANLATVVNLLIFNEVTFPSFTFTPACRNLELMDNWLGLASGYQVCPAIPSEVRAVTTPFVAFMLGLVTMGFLRRRSMDYNG